jgi:hypothetical protein
VAFEVGARVPGKVTGVSKMLDDLSVPLKQRLRDELGVVGTEKDHRALSIH